MFDDGDVVDQFVPGHFFDLLEQFAALLLHRLQLVFLLLQAPLQRSLLVDQLEPILLLALFAFPLVLLVVIRLL